MVSSTASLTKSGSGVLNGLLFLVLEGGACPSLHTDDYSFWTAFGAINTESTISAAVPVKQILEWERSALAAPAGIPVWHLFRGCQLVACAVLPNCLSVQFRAAEATTAVLILKFSLLRQTLASEIFERTLVRSGGRILPMGLFQTEEPCNGEHQCSLHWCCVWTQLLQNTDYWACRVSTVSKSFYGWSGPTDVKMLGKHYRSE